MSAVIRIVAAVAIDEAGRVLLVRKRGTTAFMQPGGKPEVGETPMAALARELLEEIGCAIEHTTARLGTFRAPAANEPDMIVEADLYRVKLIGVPEPLEEIDELRWIDPKQPGAITLAPLTRDHVLPTVVTWKIAGTQSEQSPWIASMSL